MAGIRQETRPDQSDRCLYEGADLLLGMLSGWLGVWLVPHLLPADWHPLFRMAFAMPVGMLAGSLLSLAVVPLLGMFAPMYIAGYSCMLAGMFGIMEGGGGYSSRYLFVGFMCGATVWTAHKLLNLHYRKLEQ